MENMFLDGLPVDFQQHQSLADGEPKNHGGYMIYGGFLTKFRVSWLDTYQIWWIYGGYMTEF